MLERQKKKMSQNTSWTKGLGKGYGATVTILFFFTKPGKTGKITLSYFTFCTDVMEIIN